MSAVIRLLGRPGIDTTTGSSYRFRSQKSWGLLAYVLLAERPPSRAHLAELLFASADDPLRALRWSLAEIRRGLGDDGEVEGDPVVVTLRPGTVVDVDVVTRGGWSEAIEMTGLGRELLEQLTPRGSAGFESWLITQRRHVAAVSEAVLHEAALGRMSEGDVDAAIALAERTVALGPLDENNHALLITLHRRSGDRQAARDAYDACRRLFRSELGVEPGLAVESAWREDTPAGQASASRTSVSAIVEAGAAAVAAGALVAGLTSLRTAVQLSDALGDADLRISSRIVLAETLIHSVRGLDEEGIAALHVADKLATQRGDRSTMAQVRTELGYVDFLRAHYDRAETWLTDALAHADASDPAQARARVYLGTVDSDRGDYARAMASLLDGAARAREGGDVRLEAFAISMLGRAHLLRGDATAAAVDLSRSIALAEQDHWLAFLPWPQAMLGEAHLLMGDGVTAAVLLEESFARACQVGDPCWEGMSARGLAMAAATRGDVDDAFAFLAEARVRSSRLADAYVWLEAHILDAYCELGRRFGHPDTGSWVADMQQLAARTDMREMTVRSLIHGAALGSAEDADGARLLGEGLDNDVVRALLAGLDARPAALS